jgi:transglutaminase/protease-like cytokinesis protein 3
MMLTRGLFIFLFLFLISFVQAQNLISPDRFFKADSIAIHFPNGKYNGAKELAGALTKGINNETEKFRIIYRWIAENIRYDFLNRSAKTSKVLKYRSAVCIGYSTLLSEMCSAAGLKCEIIKGHSKHSVNAITNLPKKSDHAWNAIQLAGKWHLCDVTWAAGFYNERTGLMQKKFSDTYFLLSPDKFIYNHFPEEATWQLLTTNMSRTTFSKLPFMYPGFFDLKIDEISNKDGQIKIRSKDTLTLQFKTDQKIDSVNMELVNSKKRYSCSVSKLPSGNYTIKQKMEQEGDDDLIIYFDRRAVLAYKIKIQ